MSNGSTMAIPTQADPSFFGGGGSSGDGEHPFGTTFGDLKRSYQPPVLATHNCFIDTDDELVKSLFECLETGQDLAIDWCYDEGRNTLWLQASYTGGDEPVHFFRTMSCISYLRVLSSFEMSDGFQDAVSDDKELLRLRLVHLFLRVKGSSLKWEVFEGLCLQAEQHFVPLVTSKKWKILLDLRLIRADVAFSLGRPNRDIRVCLHIVAEALEAQGRFIEATDIYLDCAIVYADGNVEYVVEGLINAALAFKCAGDFKRSEKVNVRALRVKSRARQADVGDDQMQTIFGNLVIMYYERNKLEIRHVGRTYVFDEDPDSDKTPFVEAILRTLLQIAGSPQPGITIIDILSPHLYSTSAAKAAIASACDNTSVDDFRSRILSFKKRGVNSISFTSNDAQVDYKKEDKKLARQVVRRDFSSRVCDNPGCNKREGDEFLFKKCPCKRVYYCEKSCQVSHWKAHKKSCPFRTERKNKK